MRAVEVLMSPTAQSRDADVWDLRLLYPQLYLPAPTNPISTLGSPSHKFVHAPVLRMCTPKANHLRRTGFASTAGNRSSPGSYATNTHALCDRPNRSHPPLTPNLGHTLAFGTLVCVLRLSWLRLAHLRLASVVAPDQPGGIMKRVCPACPACAPKGDHPSDTQLPAFHENFESDLDGASSAPNSYNLALCAPHHASALL